MKTLNSFFSTGQQVDIPRVLSNRDHRVQVQQSLLRAHPDCVVVAAKLNIPGPVKNNPTIQSFFVAQLHIWEKTLIKQGLVFNVADQWLKAVTGPERFYVIFADRETVKKTAVAFEESNSWRRLFDLDVIYNDQGSAKSLSRSQLGLPTRRCLICNRDAKDCGRSRRHSVGELQDKVAELIQTAQGKSRQGRIVDCLAADAVKALVDESVAWPKPGLVDPVEHGAHPDMTETLFINSAFSLRQYFKLCAQAGANYAGSNYLQLFEEIRYFGKQAEREMFRATDGKNTHKGAIFSLGILVTAVANCWVVKNTRSTEEIQTTVRAMLSHLIKEDLSSESYGHHPTAGEKQYQKYGLTGARGEAAAGFPQVFQVGLPAFRSSQGDFNDKIVMTLLIIAKNTKDSNLIKRAGTADILEWKDQVIDHCLSLGGMATKEGRQAISEMQAEFSDRHLSLGGSADLLILTIFMVLVLRYDDNAHKN